MKKEHLQELKRLYEVNNINIIDYLNSSDNQSLIGNQIEDIMISYDFQAGTYVEDYILNGDKWDRFTNRLAKEIDSLTCPKRSILECGVGEATMLCSVLKQSKTKFNYVGGLDISWSRIKRAQIYAVEQHQAFDLFVGDMFQLPLKDNSIDIVYTIHSIEPNGGKEKEILSELYRVTSSYLICVEPAYELADKKSKERMERFGYIKNLYSAAKELGFNIIKWELYAPGLDLEPLNPAGILIIEKANQKQEAQNCENVSEEHLKCCPITKTDVEIIDGAYYSPKSLLAYPILCGVPLLTEEHAVVAFNKG